MTVQIKKTKNTNESKGRFEEIGTLGLDAFAGIINEAYLKELRWPGVWPVYKRLHRADPEVSIARFLFGSMASQVKFKPRLPDNPSEDDRRFQQFLFEVLDELAPGIEQFRDKLVTHVPFMGFGWWEIVPGIRLEGWRTPNDEEGWQSRHKDGLVGVRRLAWRDYSSLYRWEIDEATGKLQGFVQLDTPNRQVTIPMDRSIHITFGDSDNPEGLGMLEPLYRLERYKFGLEVVQGIGFEHAAGYLSVTAERNLGDKDLEIVKQMARAILTAQEGNYAAWPLGARGEIIDVDFSAGPSILEAIRYYGLLKLQLFNLQWVAMATTANTGAYSALETASLMSTVSFNAVMSGFTRQFSRQLTGFLLRANPGRWPGLTAPPEITASPVKR